MKESMTELAASYLEGNAEALVSRWIDWVQERLETTTISALPERALRNHIPPVLQSLGRYLRHPGELARQDLLSHLRLHGQIRRDQGYSLKEVLAEFDGLAEIVTSGVNEVMKEGPLDQNGEEALAIATRLATGLRSVSFIAMGTFEESDDERTHSMSQQLEDFARTVAHELRSPLHTLHLGLDVLSEKVKDRDDVMKHVEVMQAAVTRSVTLLDSMLILAIAERARAGDHLISIQEAVDQIVKEFSEKAAAGSIEFQVASPMPELKVERSVIDVVLANLVGNAIKYADPAKEENWVKVAATFIEEEHDSGFCELCVSDNGLGIPEELLPRICQKGFRAHPEHAVGTGLGLYLVQQLLIERGGEIDVQSTEHEGTEVTVRIRCLAGDASALTAERFRVDHLMGESAIKSLEQSPGDSEQSDGDDE